MKVSVTIIEEKNGKKSVQIPYTQWKSIEKKMKTFQQQEEMRKRLTNAFTEVNEIKKGTRKGQSLKTYLNGLK